MLIFSSLRAPCITLRHVTVFSSNHEWPSCALAVSISSPRVAILVVRKLCRRRRRADLANALSQEWLVLDPNDYPGAGSSGLTADGQIDPLLAFVYDAVVLALAAYALSLAGGQNLTGFALDRWEKSMSSRRGWRSGCTFGDQICIPRLRCALACMSYRVVSRCVHFCPL